MSRPEHVSPPEVYYNDIEAKKYTDNSRIQTIQAEMALRTIDLLELDPDQPALLLDIGCGSGLSGEIIDQEGHMWIGMDIAPAMLNVALSRETDGDLLLSDIGHGIPFRAGTFDGAISVSVIQWLLNADTAYANPQTRLNRFFSSLYSSLRRGAKAIFQFYPESEQSLSLITSAASKSGFGGGIILDNPDSKKAKKYYLCLQVGGGSLTLTNVEIEQTSARSLKAKKHEKTKKELILKKKELYRKRGKMDVPRDSKFTGRKRRIQF